MRSNSYKNQIVIVFVMSFVLVAIWGMYHYAKKNGGTNVSLQTDGTLPYLHTNNSFTFRFPENLQFSNSAQELDGKTQETVLFSSQDPKRGFQILIAPYDKNEVFDLDSIKKSNPDLEISNAEEVIVDGITALGFASKLKSSNFVTFEVWFVNYGALYQISTYPEFKKDLLLVLSTWNWDEYFYE